MCVQTAETVVIWPCVVTIGGHLLAVEANDFALARFYVG